MTTRSNRSRRKNSTTRQSTPLGVEQLEARMMNAIDGIQQNLNLLTSSSGLGSTQIVSNAVPVVQSSLQVNGGNEVRGRIATASVLGNDDRGESNLRYSWRAISMPTGGSVLFNANNSNAAKNNTLVFNRAGTYAVGVTILDRDGNSTSSQMQFNVVEVLTTLQFRAADGRVLNAAAGTSTNATSINLSAVALDQFNNALATQPSVQWQRLTAPTGGSATLNSSGGNVTATFTRAGLYTFRATSGSISSTISVTVNQSLSGFSLVNTNSQPIVTDQPVQVNGSSQRFTLRAVDQFGQAMNVLPNVTWTTNSAPTGGRVTGSASGDSVTLAFNRLGDYSIRGRSGTITYDFLATVNPTLTSVQVSTLGRRLNSAPVAFAGTQQALMATGLDQFGAELASQPNLTWQVRTRPTGSNPSLSANGNNVDITYNRAGDYVFRVGSGNVSMDVSVAVAQTITTLSMNQTAGGAVSPNTPLQVAGTTLSLRPVGLDQFGQSMTTIPTITWRTESAPAGGTISGSTTDGLSSIVFRKLGDHVVVAKSGNATFTFTASVVPVLNSLRVLNSENRVISSTTAVPVTTTGHGLSVVGLDQFGGVLESQPTVTWQARTVPTGASPTLTPNGNNLNVLYNRAGNYVLRAQSGATLFDVSVAVAQTITTLSMNQTAGGAVSPNTPLQVAGTTLSIRPVGLDQFGQSMTTIPTITWRTESAPAGGTISGSTTNGLSSIVFRKLGDHVVVARSGNATFTFTASVIPVLSSLRASTADNRTIAAGGTVTIATTNHGLSVVGLDQFGGTLASQPSITWQTRTSPQGSSVSLTPNGNSVNVLYNRAGNYVLRATSGSTSLDVNVAVNQSLAQLSLATQQGASIDPTQAVQVTGTSHPIRVLGFDQFGVSMSTLPGITFRATSAPSGGSVTAAMNNGVATLSFNRLGNYTIEARSGTTTASFLATVNPTLTSLRATFGLDNRSFNIAQPLSVTTMSQRLTAIGVDQFGAVLATQPTFTWTSVSRPSGSTLGLTSSSSLVDLTFDRAGTYVVRATSGSLTTTISLNVIQTLSSLEVTPGTSTVESRATRQFQVTAKDQFGQTLSTRPTIAWSSTGGTVSTSGLYTAGSAAGNFSVTARVGTINSTASVQVTAPVPQTTLRNAAIASLVNSLYTDNQISRTEMMQILRSAGSDGVVDASELSDLQFLTSSSTIYAMPEYVRELGKDVVSSNPANRMYRGAVAGNLTAGSSSTLLNNLVDKWFLGTDDPVLTTSSLSYRVASGNLFNGDPKLTDARQGQLGDCYFIASLVSIADKNPNAVRNLFIDNGDGTFTTRFYAGALGNFFNNGLISSGFLSGTGTADYVTVSRRLPTYSNGSLAYSGYGLSASSASTTLWIALAEKAYAQWNETGNSGRDGTNRYAAIEGGWMATVNAQVLGYNSTNYMFSSSSKQSLVDAINAGRAVTLGTTSGASAGGLVGGHAYIVTGYNAATDTFSLHNPWGFSHPSPLTWAQLQANCSLFTVANPSGSQGFSNASVRDSVVEVSLGNWTCVANAHSFVEDHERNELVALSTSALSLPTTPAPSSQVETELQGSWNGEGEGTADEDSSASDLGTGICIDHALTELYGHLLA